MSSIGYDPKCHDLAEAFLEDDDRTNPDRETLARHADKLAQDIQKAIEDYVFSVENGLIDPVTAEWRSQEAKS